MKNRLNDRPSGALAILTGAAALCLAGCSKPPGCADDATAETIKALLADSARATAVAVKDDPNKLVDAYFKAMKVSLQNVVTDGYDSGAKKNSCQAKLTVTTVTGAEYTRQTAYATQKTEDKGSGGFIVEVSGVQGFAVPIAQDMIRHVVVKRFSGDWPGTYSCQGIGGATDGPQGPFTMPVTMVVDKNLAAKLERTTKGGGFEVMQGDFMPSTYGAETTRLEGNGKNSPDDTWHAVFDGKVQGMDFTATGKLLNENQLLRTCLLKLTLPTN